MWEMEIRRTGLLYRSSAVTLLPTYVTSPWTATGATPSGYPEGLTPRQLSIK